MKKLFTLLTLVGVLMLGTSGLNNAFADEVEETAEQVVDAVQDSINKAEEAAAAAAKEAEAAAAAAAALAATEVEKPKVSITQTLKQKFIEGDPQFMAIVLFALIIGLALCIERIIYLNMATTNTDKLLANIESALADGGVDAAKEVCRNTKGPVASIFYQGLDRSHEGLDMVEKTVVSYGSVQMGLLEKGLSWISLFIALAPMLGFMGTVIGMIQAFDRIEAERNIAPDVVAGGIKVALLTTVFGLVVAMILQIFYNYILSKIDGLVSQMEDASISMVDILMKHGLSNK